MLTQDQHTLLSAWKDGEVTPAEKVVAEELIATNAEARAYVEQIGRLRELAVDAGALASGGGSSLSGAGIIDAVGQGGATFGHATAWYSAAAALSVAIVSLLLLQSPDPSLPSESTLAEQIERGPSVLNVGPESYSPLPPPLAAEDLARFALEGVLPIDTGRTVRLAVGEPIPADEELKSALRRVIGDAIGSENESEEFVALARLLRTSVVMLEGRRVAVREDLHDLRVETVAAVTRMMEDADRPRLARAAAGAGFGLSEERILSARRNGAHMAFILVNEESIFQRPRGRVVHTVHFEQVVPVRTQQIVIAGFDEVIPFTREAPPPSVMASARTSAPTATRSSGNLARQRHRRHSVDAEPQDPGVVRQKTEPLPEQNARHRELRIIDRNGVVTVLFSDTAGSRRAVSLSGTNSLSVGVIIDSLHRTVLASPDTVLSNPDQVHKEVWHRFERLVRRIDGVNQPKEPREDSPNPDSSQLPNVPEVNAGEEM